MDDLEQPEEEWDEIFEPERLRSFPLVPEPYQSLAVNRQKVTLGGHYLTPRVCKFYPELNITRYRDTLSAEENTQLDARASRLQRHAVRNVSDEVSDSTWETDVRNDVFDRIRDDPHLRLDKHPYYYKVKDEEADSDNPLGWRTPDLTLGLATYHKTEVELEGKKPSTDVPDRTLTRGAHWSLCKERLKDQLKCPKTGLIVDGRWGEADLIFPWAVYEAKKRSTSYDDGEYQVSHAAQVYLGMLDDLARNPDDPTKFQTSQSHRYQMFAFSSSGPYWLVYAVDPVVGSCSVETLWEGNVSELSRAFDFISIVDQIHQFAITQYRDFVIRHLEPWIRKAEEHEKNRPRTAFDLSLRNDVNFCERINRKTSELLFPEWLNLKLRSQEVAAEKRLKSRRANKLCKEKQKVEENERQLPEDVVEQNVTEDDAYREIEDEGVDEMSWSPAEALK